MRNRRQRGISLTVPVRVQTRGSRSEIGDVRDGRLRIKTTAAPTGGKANRDVARQLASAFGVPPSRIELKSGAAQRDKTFVIADPSILPRWLEDLRRNN